MQSRSTIEPPFPNAFSVDVVGDVHCKTTVTCWHLSGGRTRLVGPLPQYKGLIVTLAL